MKYFIFSILGIFSSVVIIALVNDYKMSKKYIYTVEYQHGKYGWSDYTDTITYNQNHSISYTDENGRKVTRYGTYSVIKNK